jgi:geranylgeranyl diphosphate synthase type II
VHAEFGERLAVLSGDALIVLAFEVLGSAALAAPERLPALMATVARSVGMPHGIVAGQAWECEPWVALPDYQRAKTGSLFAAATEAGALAAGVDPSPWLPFGQWLGEAYQVADDIRDVSASTEEIGKPVGRDRALSRPSAVADHGLAGALVHFNRLMERTVEAIPECAGAAMLRKIVRLESQRLVPKTLAEDLARVAA